ncbi:hypothetical protein CHH27_14730 [Labrenzia sp. VG12]|nr:hypothetical protein CHH27_14730 [Labrenzia sp. VG12]
MTTIDIFADTASSGNPVYERLRVKELAKDTYRLEHSPGLVLGIAKGDVIKTHLPSRSFEIVSRSGLIAVQIYLESPVSDREALSIHVETVLMGTIDAITDKQVVLSLPYARGFQEIEAVLEQIVTGLGNAEW